MSKIEKNGIIGIIFFFCEVIYLQLILEEKILKHRPTSGRVVSPNRDCRQRNNCFRKLNEDEGFFSKFIFVTRHREGWETLQCHTVSPAKTFNYRLQYFVIECWCEGFSYLAKLQTFLPQKMKNNVRNFQHYLEIEFK